MKQNQQNLTISNILDSHIIVNTAWCTTKHCNNILEKEVEIVGRVVVDKIMLPRAPVFSYEAANGF